jgi:hypothetical protein
VRELRSPCPDQPHTPFTPLGTRELWEAKCYPSAQIECYCLQAYRERYLGSGSLRLSTFRVIAICWFLHSGTLLYLR